MPYMPNFFFICQAEVAPICQHSYPYKATDMPPVSELKMDAKSYFVYIVFYVVFFFFSQKIYSEL